MGLDAIMHGNVRPPQGIFKESVQKNADLGLKLPFADGRVYVYCKAGEGLTVGQQLQAPIVDTTNDKDLAVQTAGKAIDRELKLTIPSAHASFDANAYEGGWLLIETGTEKGLMRKIKSNDAFTTGADATVTFKFKDTIDVAVAVSGHYASIVACPYCGVMINNATNGITSTDGKPLGAAVVDVTNAYYFWAIVHGMGPAIMENSAAITTGEALTCDGPAVVKREPTAGFPLIGHAASYGANSTDGIMVYYCIE